MLISWHHKLSDNVGLDVIGEFMEFMIIREKSIGDAQRFQDLLVDHTLSSSTFLMLLASPWSSVTIRVTILSCHIPTSHAFISRS
jgi:hypothetical protein